MTQTADPQPPRPEADEVRQQLAGKHACPFCGVIRVDAQAPCPRCTMEDTPATRQATRQRIGPWFVLQARNPSAPGMKFATLVSLIKKNHVTPRSIVRGPTTHQLWTFAAQVRGLSREFGLCYSCGEAIDPAAKVCPHCDRQQMPPPDPDALLEAGAPEMVVTSQLTTHDTGMDGGTSLDLQADAPAGPPRPIRTPPPAQQQALARVTPRPATPIREALPAAKEESILTARELAAAFQLDFNPQNRRPRKKIGPVKALVSLLVIAAVSIAIVMAMRPDWRDQSLAWLNGRWSQVRASLEQPATVAPASSTPQPSVPPPTVTSKPPSQSPNPVVVKTTPKPIPAPVPPPPEPAMTAPPAAMSNKPVEAPPPVPVVQAPPPAPKLAPVFTPPPTPTVDTPPDMTIDQAIAMASDLRNQAIDAEVKKDWPTAVHLYERIQTLPHDAWPSDLQLRLDAARRHANG